ncbi:hypothetical protein N9937_01255 [bacterium]|nr:hypothetical protein [bacterium]
MIYHFTVEVPDTDELLEIDLIASCETAAQEELEAYMLRLYPDVVTLH